jgi:Ca-activated chloride channel family protein
MKIAFFSLLTLLAIIDPVSIGKINTLKSEARKAYTSGDYKLAVEKYRYLADSLNIKEDEIMLNLANAYFQTKDTANAVNTYSSVTGSIKGEIRSKAQQQLGVLNHMQGKLEEALNNFKQAIKADANNRDARINYEMLKKKLDEQNKKQEQDQQNRDKQNKENQKDKQENKDQQQNKDQQKKDQEQKDQQKKEQEQKDQQQKEQQQKEEQKDQQQKDKESKEQKDKKDSGQKEEKDSKDKQKGSPELAEKLQQMKISEEKAKMILEAMKNQEIQYLQQNKRKATKPKEKGKPDW